MDASPTVDAGTTPVDAFVAPDAPPPPADACVPTRTSCNTSLECGAIPDGCGTFACDPCGDGVTTYCAILTSAFHDRVYGCTQMAQTDHPEWFDAVMFRDTSSWLVLDADAAAYVAYVAACAARAGTICIADPGAPGNEVRCRADPGDLAENFIVRTYGTGRTATRYTSTCTPAMF